MPKMGKRSAVATPHSNDIRNADARQGTMHNIVLDCLENIPSTRSSDRKLIVEVLYKEYGDLVNRPFWEVMEADVPSFETITRCRRKIQEEHEELRAVEPFEKERIAKQMDFIEYARGETYV